MATMVIKDSFFKMIDDLETPAYLESVNQINKHCALECYREMHDYVNNNIVDLDFDVDLYTEGFEWDKSKKWYENIWEFLKNLWRALINFFKAFIGKNTDLTKEEIEKLKSTAQEAKSTLESGKEISTEQLTTGLDKLDKFLTDFTDTRSKLLKEIEKDKDISEKKQKSMLFNQLSDKFNDVKEIAVWCSKNKGKLSTEITKKLSDVITQFINAYNDTEKVDEDQKKRNIATSKGFVCVLGIQMIIDSLNLLSSIDKDKINSATDSDKKSVGDYIINVIGNYTKPTAAQGTPNTAGYKAAQKSNYTATYCIRYLNNMINILISLDTEGMKVFSKELFKLSDDTAEKNIKPDINTTHNDLVNQLNEINNNIVTPFNNIIQKISSLTSVKSFTPLDLKLTPNGKLQTMPETPKLETSFDAEKISLFTTKATNVQDKDVTKQFLEFMKDGASVSKSFLSASAESLKVNESIKIFYEILSNLSK